MSQTVLRVILNEGNWFVISLSVATIVVTAALLKTRTSARALRSRILLAMNLFYGCTVGTMAFGHLLAVTIRTSQGTLTAPLWRLYLIGAVLAIPSWWLAARAARYVADEARYGRRLMSVNIALGLALLGVGLPNVPLALPTALNLMYQTHTRPLVGWGTVTVALVLNVLLFIGALVFMASGQTFEQFQGMQ
jgi:MFS family permease